MWVTRIRVCHPTSRKIVAEALMERHRFCCPDGRCGNPDDVSYGRDSMTIPPGTPYEHLAGLAAACIRQAGGDCDLGGTTYSIALSQNGDDAVLAALAESYDGAERLF